MTPKVKHQSGTIRAYARISKRTDESQSVEQQRYKIERWRDYHHEGEAIEWYVDEGVSASKKVRRPERERLTAELGQGDVLVALKVDRLARSVGDLLDIVKRADEVGASVVFVDQQIDTRGPYGKFTLTLLAALAELEAGIIRERVKGAIETFDRDGRHGYGRLPFGFRSVRDDVKGWLVVRPHPDEGPRLRDAVLRIIDGASVNGEALSLGIPQVNLWKLVRNPRLYGRGPSGRVDKDAALITMSQWQTLQRRLEQSAPQRRQGSKAPGYGPVFFCHHCDKRLYLNQSMRPHRGGTYLCAGNHKLRASILRDVADQFVEDWFLGFYGAAPVIKTERDEQEPDDTIEQLAEIDVEIDECFAAMRNRPADRPALMEQVETLERRKTELQQGKPKGEMRLVHHGTMAKHWAESDDDYRVHLMRQVMRVVVHPASAPQRLVVEDKEWPQATNEELERKGFGLELSVDEQGRTIATQTR
ncbi:recombinase family protein [Jiangella gansuensis]|uniref:recombinase family protein n=1 Tax=Jiangella gansuensis TaxID=281473 RepID=UPI0004B27FED|nr:recombinase family protein [Jiangella gansuensis]